MNINNIAKNRWEELKCVNCMHGVTIYFDKKVKKSYVGHYGHGIGEGKIMNKSCETYHCFCKKPIPWIIKEADKVKKVGGDYTYEGIIVGVIHKRSGKIRYVVEDDRGMLFIFNENSLEKR